MTESHPNIINRGEGTSVSLGGLGVVFKVGPEHTGGSFAIVEHPLRPGALAGPPHTHTREDELMLVLEGEVGVEIGNEVFQVTPGTYVLKPRGIPHTFWNAGTEPARVQEIITPAGFEAYFREVAEILTPGAPPDSERLSEVAAKYGLTLHMDRLQDVMSTYDVTLG